MAWKFSMPPATEWQQLTDQLDTAQQGQVQFGKDTAKRWRFNREMLARVATVLGVDYYIEVASVRRFMRGYGNWGYGELVYDTLGVSPKGGGYNFRIYINPLLSPDAANYAIWHEIQHMFQFVEKRINRHDVQQLPMTGEDFDKYVQSPEETDADQMALKLHELGQYPVVTEIDVLEGDEGDYYHELLEEGWPPDEARQEIERETRESEIPLDEVMRNRQLISKTGDYQGWSNWETWNTKLMMDNERGLYDQSRKIVQTYRENPPDGEKVLENWAIQNIIAPHNKATLEDAQEWNDIPEHDRLDYHYEELKEKNPAAADIVNNLFGPDTSDVEPNILDPNKVNWYEIFQSILQDLIEEERYEQGLSPTWQEQSDPDKPGDLTVPESWS
jgi:hypothetical protein